MRAFLTVLVLTAALGIPHAPPAHAQPHEFLWGVASSGFQSEGSSPDSNWLRYSNEPHHEPIGSSVDFRHRYREDITHAAELGVDVYRISVEWARIQPTPYGWDDSELDYYDDVVREIRAHGMTPMLTLDHWVYPGWIADRGGWSDPDTVRSWLVHAETVAERYADADALWVTFNEPSQYVWQEVTNGGLAPAEVPAMFDRLVEAHHGAYQAIHRADPDARVTSNAAYIPGAQPYLDTWFLDRVRTGLDYVGVDFYYGVTLQNPTAIHATVGDYASIVPHPQGMYDALMDYADRYPGVPLYVVENGMATADEVRAPTAGPGRGTCASMSTQWAARSPTAPRCSDTTTGPSPTTTSGATTQLDSACTASMCRPIRTSLDGRPMPSRPTGRSSPRPGSRRRSDGSG